MKKVKLTLDEFKKNGKEVSKVLNKRSLGKIKGGTSNSGNLTGDTSQLMAQDNAYIGIFHTYHDVH
ncbi:MAG: hypothetical protein LBP85_03175 [Prevotellaceae bacterium]|jgi:5-keto 4-deoxyuronate isomerase|nr:hypothetical protein [Prevotellaceae bacterium]